MKGLRGKIPSFEMDDEQGYPHDYGNPHWVLGFGMIEMIGMIGMGVSGFGIMLNRD